MQPFIATYGYAAVFVLMLAESACIPIPSELIMTFAGAIAAGAVPGTHLSLAGVIIAGVAGNVAGSYVAWAVGRYGGLPAHFPKGTDLSPHTPNHLLAVENELNNRPRRVLGDRAPAELFAALLASESPPVLRR
jgi:membrane protein DedA with SNARE-associated domain